MYLILINRFINHWICSSSFFLSLRVERLAQLLLHVFISRTLYILVFWPILLLVFLHWVKVGGFLNGDWIEPSHHFLNSFILLYLIGVEVTVVAFNFYLKLAKHPIRFWIVSPLFHWNLEAAILFSLTRNKCPYPSSLFSPGWNFNAIMWGLFKRICSGSRTEMGLKFVI